MNSVIWDRVCFLIRKCHREKLNMKLMFWWNCCCWGEHFFLRIKFECTNCKDARNILWAHIYPQLETQRKKWTDIHSWMKPGWWDRVIYMMYVQLAKLRWFCAEIWNYFSCLGSMTYCTFQPNQFFFFRFSGSKVIWHVSSAGSRINGILIYCSLCLYTQHSDKTF